ncbi:DUF883 family protein [Pseudomonas lopnurensis]|uniref:DUF883 family protein n=1 Tax=Pseudomonas lopnurensis TaxID=1477517 RepID=UPI001879A169|nr:DUF883 family protein [Pseudomonas lopnurensis]MBE7374015.1 DUF883 domain-containing protein [Pseudomonas lopnurensis]
MSRFSHKPTTREEVQHEIDNLMRALDELRHDAAQDSRQHLGALRSRAESLWHDQHWDKHYADLSQRTREASRLARDCAREHPWGTVALAAGACALIGYLITRR